MSVIIRLQNLPWSANALDIRNFFRGLSIPEGGVHIVGGELGDAFIAFSTDEDARQAMMLDGGKLKEIQVKLLLSSRSEMHKVIETARQSVPILALTAPAPVAVPAPSLAPFAAVMGAHAGLGIPGIGNPLEVPQPAVIEPPAPLAPSPPTIITPADPAPEVHDVDTRDKKRGKDKRRTRSRSRSRSSSRSRSRDKKERRRRDRSRSRDRRRRNRSRSRDRKDRRRDRRDNSRSKDRISPWSRSNDGLRKVSPKQDVQENKPLIAGFGTFGPGIGMGNGNGNGPAFVPRAEESPGMETFDKALLRLQELGKKRNPEAFQVPNETPNGDARNFNGGNTNQPASSPRNDTQRRNRFQADEGCCVAIRGVPNHTSYGDLRRFFPFMIDKHGIKMINDQLGRRTGNVFVRFCEARSKALALHRRNNELKGAEVRVEHLADEEYEAAVDSFLPVRQEPAAAPAPEQPPFTIIKVEELPLFVKEHDIIKAFSEFSLLSILLSECRASRTRAAFVQFVKPEDAQAALARRDRLVFNRRAATVRPASEEEYDKVKQEQLEPPKQAERQPPPQFVREPSPAAPLPPPLQPAAPRDPRQRRPPDAVPAPTGGPLLPPGAPFFTPDFAQQQMMPMGFPGQQFGGFGPGGSEPRWAGRGGPPAGAAPRAEDEDALDCVLMKGLPRDASDRDIVAFLQETGAAPARIHLMLDVAGAPSGDCFCEFRSEEEARRAARRHGGQLQGARVSVDPVPRSVVQDALAPEGGPGGAGGPGGPGGLLGDAPVPPGFFDQPRGGFAPRAPFRGRGGFDRGGFDMGGFDRGRGGPPRGRGGFDPRGNNFDRNNDNFDRNGGGFNRVEDDSELAGGFDRGGRGFDRGGRGFGPRGGFEPLGRGRGFGRAGGGGRFDGERPPEEQDPSEDFGAPGCVVAMENVPFRASVEEILGFFGEFNLSQDDVIRRFNERGQPTGDARVAFRTPFDAQSAIATRHMQPLHARRVALKLL